VLENRSFRVRRAHDDQYEHRERELDLAQEVRFEDGRYRRLSDAVAMLRP
jgi:hypothetical protein